MESWRTVWRDGFAPVLSVTGLEALRDALAGDEPERHRVRPTPRPEAGDDGDPLPLHQLQQLRLAERDLVAPAHAPHSRGCLSIRVYMTPSAQTRPLRRAQAGWKERR